MLLVKIPETGMDGEMTLDSFFFFFNATDNDLQYISD